MNPCIVTIADSDALARTIDNYVKHFFGASVESYFMTYERNLLSGELLRKADLFVLELLRRDDIGYRAEAFYAAEKWAPLGIRVLVISSGLAAARLNKPYYWDLASEDTLHQRIQEVLSLPPATVAEFQQARAHFAEYCRPAVDNHRR